MRLDLDGEAAPTFASAAISCDPEPENG